MVLLLELARGLAASWVFLFHAKSLFESSSPLIYRLATHGSLGVPMFFVISGYVITYSAESNLKHGKSPLEFLKNRFLRIYPAFWASVIVALAAPYLIELISSLKSGHYVKPEFIAAKFNFAEWANFLILSKVFWARSSDLQAEFNIINSVYWTLAIEFQFYLVIFFALYLGKYYRHAIALVSAAALLLLFFPAGLNYGLFIYYWPAFSIGILLAYLHRNGLFFLPNLRVKALLCLAVLAAMVPLLNYSIPANNCGLFFASCFGMLLWIIADTEKLLTRIKNGSNKLAYWLLEPWLILGAMSYSVYLLHGKIFIIPDMFVRQVFNPNSILGALLTVLGTLCICYPFYFYIERRFLSKNYKKIHQAVITGAPSQQPQALARD